jgi:hypothetical protein
MKDSPPEVRYRALCTRLRGRIESAERNLASDESLAQKIENIGMHGRKAIENIAHMCLVATEHGLGELGIPQDAKQHWNAETMFNRLERRKINILPSPSRMHPSKDQKFRAIFAGVKEHRLSYKELVDLYRLFHEPMHEPNPYRTPDPNAQYRELLPKMAEAITKLRNFTWVHFISIKGEGFGVDLKNEFGATQVISLKRVAPVSDPDDYLVPTPKPLPASMSGVQIPDLPHPSKPGQAKPSQALTSASTTATSSGSTGAPAFSGCAGLLVGLCFVKVIILITNLPGSVRPVQRF